MVVVLWVSLFDLRVSGQMMEEVVLFLWLEI